MPLPDGSHVFTTGLRFFTVYGPWGGADMVYFSFTKNFKVYNIWNNELVKLMDFIQTLEQLLGKKANMEFLPMQPATR